MLKRNYIGAGLLSCFLLIDLHAAPMDSLSQHLARGVSSLKNKKVAVLTFPYHDGKFSSGSSIVSERLTTLLVGKKNIRVIERRLIQQLLAEKKLSETGLINPESLKAMASVLNVDALVTGTLIDLKNGQTEINARMILANSGEVLSAAQGTIARTWSDDPVKLRVKEPVEPSVQVVDENRTEEKPVKTTAAVLLPQPKPGKSLSLSNESFPAGRRRYLSNKPQQPKRAKTSALYEQNLADNAYDSGYGEGYYEASRDSQNKKSTTYQNTSNNAFDSSFNSTLQHPTKVGVVRHESNWNSYGNKNYRSTTTKSKNYR